VGVGESSSFGLVPPSVASRETPLSPGRYKLQFTADQRLHDKLKQAQELLRHQVPSGDIAVVFERALDLLIAQRKKQLYAQTDKPRAQPAAKACNEGSRHVPHAVRREVLARDGEQCSFVSSDGRRCPAHGMLEFHHQTPYTRGGAATADNIQTLCRAHNALMAERDYGRTFMRERIARQRTVATPPARAVGQRVPERADGALHSEPPRALATPARASSANTSHGSGAVTRANRSTATRPAHATSADGPNLQKQQLTWSNSEPGPKPAQAPSFNAFQSLRT
jgi:hypothetical protein